MCFGTLFLFSFDKSFGLIVCNEIGVLYYSIEKCRILESLLV